ncbi:hypothetical protein FRC16_006148 [Serendipita sp. 398]|nr:hypothetical protein FRC16_006148 [Serendipita sp. 398]
MNLVPSETKTLRGSTSLSSLSRSSKNILSFTKLRPSSSKTNLRPTPPIENTALPQPRPVQRNSSRRLSMRDSHAHRNSAAIPGKRPGIQRRVSGKSYINGSSAKRPSTAPSASTPSSTFLPKSTGPFGSQPTSPITNSFKRTSIRVAPRQSMMRRLARKLQTSRTERDEDAMAELPIQRAPSLRRQPSRASNYRSRPVSGIITPDFMFPPREPSRRLSPSRLETAEEYDSNFSTDSEADDPITMKATPQARRRTRIVFGEVVDLVDDDQLDYGVSRSSSSVDRSLSPVWSNTAAMSIGAQMLSMSRRGSGGSSIPSIQEEEEEEEDLSEKAEVHPAQKSTFSLNSSEEGDPPIGVALTSEVREAATPSPITFAEPKSLKSTLFTRRKNRNHKLEGIRYPLRVDTPPPVPPLPDSVPSTATYSPRTPPNLSPSVTSLNPLEQYDSIKLNHFHKNSVADALPPPPPMPLSAPSKRKSFFRYPFVSKRSSSKSSSSSNTNSNGNERPSTSSRLASPPPPSPRAMAPPASAHHSRSNFFFTGRSIAGSLSAASNVTSFSTHGTPSSPPTATPRQFRSFSRPSSSNEKQPYGTTSYSQEGIARHVHEGPHFDNRRPGDVAYAT